MDLNIKKINTPFKIEDFDDPIQDITKYVVEDIKFSDDTYEAARICFLDSLACAYMALSDESCLLRLGGYIPNSIIKPHVIVPGTSMKLDPIRAAFSFTTCIRWLDYNDTWLAAEWGHPSDNLGAIWAASVFANYTRKVSMETILKSMTKAYEIQGVLALENAFNRCGLDHVVLVKVASSAVLTNILGGDVGHILSAVSNSWIDGQSLRTYRHGINTGPRKSWAAADAVMRAFNLGWMALFAGEPGYTQALSAKGWGFYDVLFNGNKFEINRKFKSYVMDNILLKVSFPAEFHGQTAVECGLKLHKQVKNRIDSIIKIHVRTQDAAMRIINKPHKLTNYADRDHCLQYMLAVAMLSGKIDSNSYSDSYANDNPMIEVLREKMHLEEDESFSADYLAADKRSISNAVKVEFSDGSATDWVKIEYPLGHKRRRAEAKPELKRKLIHALDSLKVDSSKADRLNSLWDIPIDEFMNIPISEMVILCQK